MIKEKPDFDYNSIKRMEDMSWFTYAQIFDDLLIVAQRETNCFVWKTSDGLVVIDGIWPKEEAYQAIIRAITETGWDPDTINKFVITHGHVDHAGCGRWLVENHHATTYLSKTDDLFWREHPTKPDRPETWKDFEIDCYVKEGDRIVCGDKEITVIDTPGHTPGCLSYIFPVTDQGVKHMAALFGGTTPPRNNEEGVKVQKRSIEHFIQIGKEMGVDVALTNHTAFDNGLERIAYSRKRLAYLPNIYVLGKEGFERFCQMYRIIMEA